MGIGILDDRVRTTDRNFNRTNTFTTTTNNNNNNTFKQLCPRWYKNNRDTAGTPVREQYYRKRSQNMAASLRKRLLLSPVKFEVSPEVWVKWTKNYFPGLIATPLCLLLLLGSFLLSQNFRFFLLKTHTHGFVRSFTTAAAAQISSTSTSTQLFSLFN